MDVQVCLNVGKVQSKDQPVIPYLRKFTSNQALLDIISQHFFADTPAYFALSYFKIFQEYYYPKGGTGCFVEKLVELIKKQGGTIRTSTEIASIDPIGKTVTTADGEQIAYRQLLWTADQKRLYNSAVLDEQTHPELTAALTKRKAYLADKTGSDSIFSLFLTADLEPDYFKSIASEHVFYTPSRAGQSQAGPMPLEGSQAEIQAWLEKYLALTTYEIAIPALRDPDLAPPGKTGLIISVLCDYTLTKRIADQGWYDEFKQFVARVMVKPWTARSIPACRRAHAVFHFHSPQHPKSRRYNRRRDYRLVFPQPIHPRGKPADAHREHSQHHPAGYLPGRAVGLQSGGAAGFVDYRQGCRG
jgi:phytoene dehydrogenase-like protein